MSVIGNCCIVLYLVNESLPKISLKKRWKKKDFFKVQITHSSVTIQKVSFFSKASYSWRRRGCCSVFMISTSLMTSSLSCSPFTAINFAARNLPVFFSLHFFTSPNFPLQNQNLLNKINFINRPNMNRNF